MKKQWIAAVMLFTILLGMFAGCGNKSGAMSDPEQTGSRESTDLSQKGKVYTAEYLPISLPEGTEIYFIENFCAAEDGSAYFGCEAVVGQKPMNDPVSGETLIYEDSGQPILQDLTQYLVFKIDPETGAVSQIASLAPKEIPEGHEGASYFDSIQVDSDGNILLQESYETYFYDLPADFDSETDDPYMYYASGDRQKILHRIRPDGTEADPVTLQIPPEVYTGSVKLLDDGRICTTDWQNIYLFNQDGTPSGTITTDGDGIERIFSFSDGRLAAMQWKENGIQVLPVQLDSMTLGEPMAAEPNVFSFYDGGGKYLYYYEKNGHYFGYNSDTTSGEPLFSWLDCDVDQDRLLSDAQFFEDGRVAAVSQTEDGAFNLILLKQVDAASLPVKEELVLGCYYLDWNIRASILRFNRAQDNVRITVREYYPYDDENGQGGIQKLNTELMSGMMPDLFLLSQEMPVEQYEARGFFQDLYPLLDSDGELSREDLMTHFFDALSNNGRLYRICDGFSISTLAGKESVVGTGNSWTMEQLMAAWQKQPEGTSVWGVYDTQQNVLFQCIRRGIRDFIQWDTLQCSFDSQEFIDILRFAKQFPKEINYEEIWKDQDYVSDTVLLRSGRQMLSQVGLYGFSELLRVSNVFGEKANYVGYPSGSGNGHTFEVYKSLAISSSCQKTDAAWQFIRTFLTEDYQRTYTHEFPTNRHVFDEKAAWFMTKTYYEDPGADEKIPEPKSVIWYDDSDPLEIYEMSQEELDQFMELYQSCSTVSSQDTQILNLITEETAAFFDGKKTAEETAKLVQDKISLYVMENG